MCSGYMPPEYAVDGKFSIKSDIFSFGVVLLEIISGRRNRGFSHPDHHHNLLGHVSSIKWHPIMTFLLLITSWSYFYLFGRITVTSVYFIKITKTSLRRKIICWNPLKLSPLTFSYNRTKIPNHPHPLMFLYIYFPYLTLQSKTLTY